MPHPTPENHDLNKLESTSPEDASTQVSNFLANWFMRKKILKDINKFPIIFNHLPLKEDVAHYFTKLETPLPFPLE